MVDWSQIDTVLLDMDGTLLDLSFDNFFWREHLPVVYAQHSQIPVEEARVMLAEFSDSLMGTLEWYCIDHWTEKLEFDVEAAKRQVKEHIRFRPYTLQFLDFLNKQNKVCIVVTNAHPKTMELKVTTVELHQHLDKIISSHEFKLAKENHGFWPMLAKREGLDLANCLFIDDSLSVLTRAQTEGVGHILHILQPDTTLKANTPNGFPAIHDFNELMPHKQNPV